MKQSTTTYVAMDTHKKTISLAIAEGRRRGETRFIGEIPNRPEAVAKMADRLARKHGKLAFCYEAGPCGYGLYRQLTLLGHECVVVAPSLIPTRPGDRVKTDRRDAVTQASLFRSGELTPVWIPDEAHEAMRDLCRARQAAVEALRRARQQVSGFLLRHGRIYADGKHWTSQASILARRATLRASGATNRLRGAGAGDGRDEGAPRSAVRTDAGACAVLVACESRRSHSSLARDRRDCGHHPRCGDRRLQALRQSAPAHGLSGANANRTLVRRQDGARRDHQSRQHPGEAHVGRERLDLSAAGANGS